MKSLRTLSLLAFLFLASCGQNVNTFQSNALSQRGIRLGTLAIAGSIQYISYSGNSYFIDQDRSEPSALSYLSQLQSHQAGQPYYHDDNFNTDLFRVRFEGLLTTGACPAAYHSNGTCNLVILQSLSLNESL